ncbi:4-demethylwyosine synthase TYW1 [Candidatus Woesearchaeota archaeon]|nr:MAG: 4-demethylwyosine synthase TYW1 [Candidatus Woesearchaeota archaeon]
MDANTMRDLSLSFAIATMPEANENIPVSTAARKGTVSFRLLKNPAPPLSPSFTKTKNTIMNMKKARIRHAEHQPALVSGIILADILPMLFSLFFAKINLLLQQNIFNPARFPFLMLSPTARKNLEKQGYRIIGSHSAVKVCGWTKKMIKGEGGCYKLKFYGIMSNQCLQMSTSLSCANRCVFCWRGYKAPVSKNWKWGVDDPEFIVENSIKAQLDLLKGFGGNPDADRSAYEASKTIKHVALSLTGEPITYPRINDAIAEFHRRGISTFLVTNAQYPDEIRNLAPVTQLYLSMDAPTEELLREIDKPLFPDFWERYIESMHALAQKKHRTCVRITAIKDMNMSHERNYAELLRKADPDFIEIKGYMFVGASRQRLSLKNMPLHEEVVAFAKRVVDLLPDYEIVSEHIPSRVVMAARKDFFRNGKWHTWIDFDAFMDAVNSGREISSSGYVRLTPASFVGLSGKGTLDRMSAERRARVVAERGIAIDENTEELDFWKESEASNGS